MYHPFFRSSTDQEGLDGAPEKLPLLADDRETSYSIGPLYSPHAFPLLFAPPATTTTTAATATTDMSTTSFFECTPQQPFQTTSPSPPQSPQPQLPQFSSTYQEQISRCLSLPVIQKTHPHLPPQHQQPPPPSPQTPMIDKLGSHHYITHSQSSGAMRASYTTPPTPTGSTSVGCTTPYVPDFLSSVHHRPQPSSLQPPQFRAFPGGAPPSPMSATPTSPLSPLSPLYTVSSAAGAPNTPSCPQVAQVQAQPPISPQLAAWQQLMKLPYGPSFATLYASNHLQQPQPHQASLQQPTASLMPHQQPSQVQQQPPQVQQQQPVLLRSGTNRRLQRRVSFVPLHPQSATSSTSIPMASTAAAATLTSAPQKHGYVETRTDHTPDREGFVSRQCSLPYLHNSRHQSGQQPSHQHQQHQKPFPRALSQSFVSYPRAHSPQQIATPLPPTSSTTTRSGVVTPFANCPQPTTHSPPAFSPSPTLPRLWSSGASSAYNPSLSSRQVSLASSSTSGAPKSKRSSGRLQNRSSPTTQCQAYSRSPSPQIQPSVTGGLPHTSLMESAIIRQCNALLEVAQALYPGAPYTFFQPLTSPCWPHYFSQRHKMLSMYGFVPTVAHP